MMPDRTFTCLSMEGLTPEKAHMAVFYCPHNPAVLPYTGPLSSEQPNSYFKIPARQLINDTDGGFLSSSRALFSDLTHWPGNVLVELHQPPKPLWVNTPHSPEHASECWHGPRPGLRCRHQEAFRRNRDAVVEGRKENSRP